VTKFVDRELGDLILTKNDILKLKNRIHNILVGKNRSDNRLFVLVVVLELKVRLLELALSWFKIDEGRGKER